MARTWTEQDVVEWIGTDAVGFLDREAKVLPLPDWVRAGGATVRAQWSAGQRVAAVHPDDRQQMIENFWVALHHPGEVVEAELRMRSEHGWIRELNRQVNLLDEPGIGAMVMAVRTLGNADEVDLAEVVQSGEFEEVNLLIHELDAFGVILKTEGRVEEITGRRIDTVIGQSVLDHLHPDGFDDALSVWMEVMGGPPGTTRTGRQRVLRPDGTTIWTESTTIKREAEDGTVTATVICHDLTERRKQEAALRTSQLEFRLLADQVPGAVFQADAQQRITFRNARWAELIEPTSQVEHLHDLVHPDDRDRYDEQIRVVVERPGQSAMAIEVRSATGERTYAISCQSVLDLVNETRSFVGSITDITSTVQLRRRAERDGLTGLLNRTALEEHLEATVATDAESATVVFIDLDGFKLVNDTHGHAVGDEVLVAVARRLQDSVRDDDVVGRFGGDEFVVVMRNAELDDEAVIARIDAALAGPIVLDALTWQPAASVGVARPRPGDPIAEVLHHADREMFAAKRQRKLRLA